MQNKPIIARPASASYRLRKYVRRHRLGVSVATGAVIVLIAFAVTQSIQLRRIALERDRADRVAQFMTDMFKVPDPGESRGNSVTAREILDKASKDIESGLAKEPELQGDLTAIMASTYLNLGLYQRAQELLDMTVSTRRRVLGPNNRKTLESVSLQGWILQRRGHLLESESLLRETFEAQNRALGAEDTDALTTLSRLGITLNREGKYKEAETAQRRVLEIRRRTVSPDDNNMLTVKDNLADTLQSQGRYAEAEELQREVIESNTRVHGEEYPLTLREMNNLGNTLEREGRYPEAEKILSHAVELQVRVLGPQHPSTLLASENLATVLLDEGHYPDAEKIYTRILDAQRNAFGPENPDTLHSIEMLGLTLAYEKRFPEAEKLFREALRIAGNAPGVRTVSGAWYNFACAAAVAGHREDALSYLREAIDHGYGNAKQIASDGDLKSLQDDPRFQGLLAHARQRDEASH